MRFLKACKEDAATSAAKAGEGRATIVTEAGEKRSSPAWFASRWRRRGVRAPVRPQIVSFGRSTGRACYQLYEGGLLTEDGVQVLAPHRAHQVHHLPAPQRRGDERAAGKISRELADGIAAKLDTTGASWGSARRHRRARRLLRNTVDHRSLEDQTVTVRERDSCTGAPRWRKCPLIKLCSMAPRGRRPCKMEKRLHLHEDRPGRSVMRRREGRRRRGEGTREEVALEAARRLSFDIREHSRCVPR